jgi:hypothetical protein
MLRHIIRLTVLAALVATAFLGAAARAGADGSLLGGGCGSLAPTFAPWGDVSDYYFPANGGFESGSAGWSLSGGASVVSGNEPFFLNSAGDSHALAVPAGGSASISLCYGVAYPAVRFMVAGSGARVHVSVTTQNLLGIVSTLDGGTFNAGSQWAPSPKLLTLFSALIAPLGSKSMQLRIDVSGGSVLVDDLYVDPFTMKS